jgi:hypothetical protein
MKGAIMKASKLLLKTATVLFAAFGLCVIAAPQCPSGLCRTNDDCAPAFFCYKAEGNCEGWGACVRRPLACGDVYMPVCGCDGQTHGNQCYAAAAGVSVFADGECEDVLCPEHECGPALGMPNYLCPNGTLGGPTGRCLYRADGSCGWEVRECPGT